MKDQVTCRRMPLPILRYGLTEMVAGSHVWAHADFQKNRDYRAEGIALAGRDATGGKHLHRLLRGQ